MMLKDLELKLQAMAEKENLSALLEQVNTLYRNERANLNAKSRQTLIICNNLIYNFKALLDAVKRKSLEEIKYAIFKYDRSLNSLFYNYLEPFPLLDGRVKDICRRLLIAIGDRDLYYEVKRILKNLTESQPQNTADYNMNIER